MGVICAPQPQSAKEHQRSDQWSEVIVTNIIIILKVWNIKELLKYGMVKQKLECCLKTCADRLLIISGLNNYSISKNICEV